MQRSGRSIVTLLRVFLLMTVIVMVNLLMGIGSDRPFPPIRTADAAPMCRQVDGHKICILTIKRSAKNYWEYRASVRIDDKKYPVKVYNCRDRIKTLKNRNVRPFKEQGAGALICSLLYK